MPDTIYKFMYIHVQEGNKKSVEREKHLGLRLTEHNMPLNIDTTTLTLTMNAC